MRKTLLPAFLDEIKFIPVPRIEFSDKQFDVVVENVIISGETLIPNFFDVKAESFASFNFKSDQDTSSSHQSLLIHMSEIQADINDVLFSYSKKTGFPKVKDQGVASLAIDKKGISIVTRVQSTNNPAKTFKVTYCKCHVDHIKVKVNDSKHDILYKMVLPLVMGTVRKQIARAIEMKIVESLNTLDQKVTMSLVNVNQKAQNKAYDALPESEKANVQPEQLSQARPRPGLFSTLVTVMNRNIQAKTEKRNMEKKNKKSNKSPTASMETDRYNALPDAASSTANSSFRQPPSSSQLKNHPNSALASNTLNNEYTDLSQNIPSATLSSNQPISIDPSESTTASMETDRYHAIPDATSGTADSLFRQPPSSSQLKSYPDSALASNTLNNEYTDLSQNIPSATLSSNQPISIDPSYPQQSSNDQIDISKIPHPSASTFNNPNNALPSDTGTHNTPLSHGHTIDQESKAARMGIQDKQRDETNHLMSSYSQPIPKHDPSFDTNNDTVNSNGIDNQHFKLAMELGEAQNPNLPGQQTRGQMEEARQL
jgi:hypothetical protein